MRRRTHAIVLAGTFAAMTSVPVAAMAEAASAASTTVTASCWATPGHYPGYTCVSPNYQSQSLCLEDARFYRQAGYSVGACRFDSGSWGPWYFLYS